MYICIYSILSRGITVHTVIYGVHTRFCPTLAIPQESLRVRTQCRDTLWSQHTTGIYCSKLFQQQFKRIRSHISLDADTTFTCGSPHLQASRQTEHDIRSEYKELSLGKAELKHHVRFLKARLRSIDAQLLYIQRATPRLELVMDHVQEGAGLTSVPRLESVCQAQSSTRPWPNLAVLIQVRRALIGFPLVQLLIHSLSAVSAEPDPGCQMRQSLHWRWS